MEYGWEPLMYIAIYAIISGLIFGYFSSKIANFYQDSYKVTALGLLSVFWPVTILVLLCRFMWRNAVHGKK